MSFMAARLPKPRSPAPALLPLRRHFTLTKVESSETENFAPGGMGDNGEETLVFCSDMLAVRR